MPHSWVGKTIGGRYRVEVLLGQGGMSAVYRAIDPNLRRPVAIKLIHPHLSEDPNFIGRFKEEAAAIARLRHPNIVQVHDFDQDGDTYFMVMDYLVGETLQARLKRLNSTARHISFQEAIDICSQICDAAGYAHNHELIHRDIKPANIMLDVNGQAILMDFGIVKIIGGEYNTATGATIGTAKYMSPEQIRGERVDDRSDIYSLGVTLYEMISGYPPYQADSSLTLMMMVLNDPLPDLREARAKIPDALLAAINKAVAKEKSERYASMEEMGAALRRIRGTIENTPPEPTVADEIPPGALNASESPTASRETSADKHLEPLEDDPISMEGRPESLPSVQEVSPHGENIPIAPEIPGKQVRPSPDSKRPAKQTTDKYRSKRRIVYTVSAVILLAIISAVVILISARRQPVLQLTPIVYSQLPITAQAAPNVVNLGIWDIDSYVVDMAFSPNGTLLATANDRDWIRLSNYRYYSGLWQVEDGNFQRYLLGHTQWVNSIAFSPDGQLVASASDDSNMIIWQVERDEAGRIIENPNGGITGIDFSPSNLLLATGSWDGVVSLWEVSSGNLLRTMQDSENGILDVKFSPDGSLIAAASEDSSILIWRVADGNLYLTLPGHTAAVTRVVFSPDGLLLASGSEDHSARLWQLDNGLLIRSLFNHSETVTDVAFSLDGSLLASGSEDGMVMLWQVSDGQLLSTLTGEASVLSLAFAPNGFYLATGTANGTIQFWGLNQALLPEVEPTLDLP